MGWRDDPVVTEQQTSAQPAWMADPVVSGQPAAQPQSAPQPPRAAQPSILDRAAQIAVGTNPIAAPFAEFATHAATSQAATPLAGLAGIFGSLMPGKQGQGAQTTEAVSEAMTYQPRGAGGQLVQKAAGIIPGAIHKGADAAGQVAADATGSPVVGAAVNTGVQTLPALLLRGPTARMAPRGNSRTPGPSRPAAAAAVAERTPTPAQRPTGLASVSKDAPTLDKLRTDKNAAYKRAEDAGVQLSEFSFKKLKGKIITELGERVDPTLHPDTTAALKRVIDTKGSISLEKLDSLRQIANDAKGSVKPADQRLAGKIVESIDEYLDGISPKDITRGDPKGAAALKEARDLNTRLKKGEQIEELFRRAEIKAGANYTQSGMENALRGEFKALALDAKKMKRFTPEERAAITKVAKGGKVENAFRFLGKFAPTGVVSGVLTGGAGAMIGGPAGAALPLAGLAGRAVATRMTMRNANRASELVRRGRNALAEAPKKTERRNALLEY